MEKSSVASRKMRILDLVKERTLSALETTDIADNLVNAGMIAELLHMDRANVSRELNDFHKAGLLIKMQGKPTLYIYKAYLLKKFPGAFFPSTIPKGIALSEYTDNVKAAESVTETYLTEFETQTGANGTMKSAIMLAKAALMYPPRGLPMLITGSLGAGKTYFVQQMYDYAKKAGYIGVDAPLVTFNCRELAISPNVAIGQIFGMGSEATPKGERGKKGLLERASGGIFCIDGIELLPSPLRDRLITLLDHNSYTRLGEPSTVRYANALVVATSKESSDSEALSPFRYRFPVVIHIPNLDCWTLYERTEILLHAFQEESATTGLTFKVERDVLFCFLSVAYNLREIISTVRLTCSLMYAKFHSAIPKTGFYKVGFHDLPESLLKAIRNSPEQEHQINEFLDGLTLEYVVFSPGGITTNQLAGTQLMDILRSGSSELLERSSSSTTERVQKRSGRLPILAVFRGVGVGEGMAGYVNSALNSTAVYGLSYQPDMSFESLLEQVKTVVNEIGCVTQLLIATDLSPLPHICDALEMVGIHSVCITDVSLKTLLALARRVMDGTVSLDDLVKVQNSKTEDITPANNSALFINRTVNEVLAPTLTFLNPQKALEVLQDALDKILDELKMQPSADITVKFIFHCSHMLERLICGNKLKYDRLKIFVNEHGELMSVVEHCMAYTAEIFGVYIPASELAYIAEIFIAAE